MVQIRFISKAGLRDVLIFFLGLNLAWIETTVNAIVVGGADNMLGWPPFNWYMPAFHWFWIHFALTGLAIGVLLYLDRLMMKTSTQSDSRGG